MAGDLHRAGPKHDEPPLQTTPVAAVISNSTILKAAAALVLFYFLALGVAKLANLWILIFGSIVFAVVLRSIADPLVHRFKFKDGLAVGVAVLLVILIVTAIGILFGRQLAEQVGYISTTLPQAWERVQTRIEISEFGGLLDPLGHLSAEAGRVLAFAPGIAWGIAAGSTTMVLVIVAGVFLAIRPDKARDGVLSMAPIDRRQRLGEVMNACGRALKGWLTAQLVSMVTVGILVGLGLWAIGVPAPLALGLLTGLAQFVPIVGPIASAVPALVIAASGGPQSLTLTLALYVVVSQLDANVITPLVQKNLASLPIVLGIFAVVGFGALFGPLGVLFATPLALAIYTALTMLYREDILHDQTAVAPGENPS